MRAGWNVVNDGEGFAAIIGSVSDGPKEVRCRLRLTVSEKSFLSRNRGMWNMNIFIF